MFCIKCGTELPDDAKFCYKCGQKMNSEMFDCEEDDDITNEEIIEEIMEEYNRDFCPLKIEVTNFKKIVINEMRDSFTKWFKELENTLSNNKILCHPTKTEIAIEYIKDKEKIDQRYCCDIFELMFSSFDMKNWCVFDDDVYDTVLENRIPIYFSTLDFQNVFYFNGDNVFELRSFFNEMKIMASSFQRIKFESWKKMKDHLIYEDYNEIFYSSNEKDNFNIVNKNKSIYNKSLTNYEKTHKWKYVEDYMIDFYDHIIKFILNNKSIVFPVNNAYVYILCNKENKNNFLQMKDLFISSNDGINWCLLNLNDYEESKKHRKHFYISSFECEYCIDLTTYSDEDIKSVLNFLNMPIPIRACKNKNYELNKCGLLYTVKNIDINKTEDISMNKSNRNIHYIDNIPIYVNGDIKFVFKLERIGDILQEEFHNEIETNLQSEKDPYKYIETTLSSFSDRFFNSLIKIGNEMRLPFSKEVIIAKTGDDLEKIYKPFYTLSQRYNTIINKVEEATADHELDNALRGQVQGGGFGLKGFVKGALIAGVINKTTSILSNAHFSVKMERYLEDEFKVFKENDVKEMIYRTFEAQTYLFILCAEKLMNIQTNENFYDKMSKKMKQDKYKNTDEKLYWYGMLFSLNNIDSSIIRDIFYKYNRKETYQFCKEIQYMTLVFDYENSLLTQIENTLYEVQTSNNKYLLNQSKKYLVQKEIETKEEFGKFSTIYQTVIKALEECNERLNVINNEDMVKEFKVKYKDVFLKIENELSKKIDGFLDKNNFDKFDDISKVDDIKGLIGLANKVCEVGIVSDMNYYLGLLYCYCKEDNRNYKLAIDQFKKYEEINKGLALYHIANIKQIIPDCGIKESYQELIMQSCKNNCAIAYLKVGNELRFKYALYWKNTNLTKKEIDKYLKKAYKLGNKEALSSLGYYYYEETERDLFSSIDKIGPMIEDEVRNPNSNLKSVYIGYYILLYRYYTESRRTSGDYQKGIDYIEKAAELGSAYAQYTVANVYFGAGNINCDLPKAEIWLNRLIENDNEDAKKIKEERKYQIERHCNLLKELAELNLEKIKNKYRKELNEISKEEKQSNKIIKYESLIGLIEEDTEHLKSTKELFINDVLSKIDELYIFHSVTYKDIQDLIGAENELENVIKLIDDPYSISQEMYEKKYKYQSTKKGIYDITNEIIIKNNTDKVLNVSTQKERVTEYLKLINSFHPQNEDVKDNLLYIGNTLLRDYSSYLEINKKYKKLKRKKFIFIISFIIFGPPILLTGLAFGIIGLIISGIIVLYIISSYRQNNRNIKNYKKDVIKWKNVSQSEINDVKTYINNNL